MYNQDNSNLLKYKTKYLLKKGGTLGRIKDSLISLTRYSFDQLNSKIPILKISEDTFNMLFEIYLADKNIIKYRNTKIKDEIFIYYYTLII